MNERGSRRNHGREWMRAARARTSRSRMDEGGAAADVTVENGSAARGARDVAVEDGLAPVAAGGADRLVGDRADVVGEDLGDGVGAVHARAILDVLLELRDDDQDVVVDDVVEVDAPGGGGGGAAAAAGGAGRGGRAPRA